MSTRMEGDTYPLTLKVGDDLTGCTAALHVHPNGAPEVLLMTIPLEITTAAPTSVVQCEWDPSLDPAMGSEKDADYWVHVEITDSTGETMGSEYDSLTVRRHAMIVGVDA